MSHFRALTKMPNRHPPLPPREEGCRRVIPAASTWPPTMSRMSDGDKPRAVRNARWPRSAPVRSGWGRRASYRRATPASSSTGHTARLALLHGEGTPSHIQAIAPGSLRLRLHAATALHSSRATSGLSTVHVSIPPGSMLICSPLIRITSAPLSPAPPPSGGRMPARHSGCVYVAADNVPAVGWGQATCRSQCPLAA